MELCESRLQSIELMILPDNIYKYLGRKGPPIPYSPLISAYRVIILVLTFFQIF